MSDCRHKEPLLSSYADDPEMSELVEEYLESLPTRIQSLQSGFKQQDHLRLTRIAHQLKGASAGYGFAPIGEIAAQLEDTLRTSQTVELDEVSTLVDDLIDLCHHAMASADKPAH